MTSGKDRRQRLLDLARSRKAAGSSTGTTETISDSPLSVTPAEVPEPVVERKRKRLVKAHSTATSTEEESSGSPLIHRRRKVTETGGSSPLRPEKTEKGASPPLPAQTTPTPSPSPTPLLSPTPLPAPFPPTTLPTPTAGSGPAHLGGASHHGASPLPQRSAATTEGGGESSLPGPGSSTEGLRKVLKLTTQLIQNRDLLN